MKLYLVHHAEAKREEEDSERTLTEKGRDDIESVARFAAERGIRLPRIVHSGKTRAMQTAEVLAKLLHPAGGILRLKGLAPLDDPKIALKQLTDSSDDLMVVGHLPHLTKLAARLLCGEERGRPVEFTNGSMVALSRDDSGIWSVGWMITPEIC